jgi:hypothetical protein
VKTQNLIPWCNLFSTASKYNISIRKSRFHYLFLFSGCIFLILLLISFFSYAYQVVLISAVLFITLLSIVIVQKNDKQLAVFHLIIDDLGLCSLEYIIEKRIEDTAEGTNNLAEQFQLLTNSRCSFLGCWLNLAPISNLYLRESFSNVIVKKSQKKRLFIYRDSLSKKDFSRLSRVIRNLKINA